MKISSIFFRLWLPTIFFLANSSSVVAAAPESRISDFRILENIKNLLDEPASFNSKNLEHWLNLKSAKINCVEDGAHENSLFQCDMKKSFNDGVKIDLRYQAKNKSGQAFSGVLTYNPPINSCASVKDAEIIFARHFSKNFQNVYEPKTGENNNFPSVFKTEYGNFESNFYIVSLIVNNECISEIAIKLTEK